jgi:imidazolonepropionase-like amidohydrolase
LRAAGSPWPATASPRSAAGEAPGAIDLGRAVILPALVNVHTHLELSYLHERVPAGTTFSRWVRTLMALRRDVPGSVSARDPDGGAPGHHRRTGERHRPDWRHQQHAGDGTAAP